MRFFSDIDEKNIEKIFYKCPSTFDLSSPRELLSYALGATLYMPAIRPNIAKDIMESKYPGLGSCVICLEDAIDDSQVEEAERNLFINLEQINNALKLGEIKLDYIPMIFVRVKNIEGFRRLINNHEKLSPLCGFVFPKFCSENGEEYFSLLKQLGKISGRIFYGMPILESSNIIYKETRTNELVAIKGILDNYKDLVLNVRIGATDLSSIYSIRREFDQTIYDIRVISDCISDIINTFLRADNGYVVSGPVWEYFRSGDRLLKPQLRESAFTQEMGRNGLKARNILLDQYIDGLIKETLLDKANGLTGKTIIHPTHIHIVNALQVVTREEYEDASSILNCDIKGVTKSAYSNKMNESKPHANWAKKIMMKSIIYGVLNENRNYTSLFE